MVLETKNLAAFWSRDLSPGTSLGKPFEITSSLPLTDKPSPPHAEGGGAAVIWQEEPCPDLESLGWSLFLAADDIALWKLQPPSGSAYRLHAIDADPTAALQDGSSWIVFADRLQGRLSWLDEDGQGLLLGRLDQGLFAAPLFQPSLPTLLPPNLPLQGFHDLLDRLPPDQAWLRSFAQDLLQRRDLWFTASAIGTVLRFRVIDPDEARQRLTSSTFATSSPWSPPIQALLDAFQGPPSELLLRHFTSYARLAFEEASDLEACLLGEPEPDPPPVPPLRQDGTASPSAHPGTLASVEGGHPLHEDPPPPSPPDPTPVSWKEILLRSLSLFRLRDSLASVAFVLGRPFSKRCREICQPLDQKGSEIIDLLPDSPRWQADPLLRASWLRDPSAWWSRLLEPASLDPALEAALSLPSPASVPKTASAASAASVGVAASPASAAETASAASAASVGVAASPASAAKTASAASAASPASAAETASAASAASVGVAASLGWTAKAISEVSGAVGMTASSFGLFGDRTSSTLLLPPEEVQQTPWFRELEREYQRYGEELGARRFVESRANPTFQASDAPHATTSSHLVFRPKTPAHGLARLSLEIPDRFSSRVPTLRLFLHDGEGFPWPSHQPLSLCLPGRDVSIPPKATYVDLDAVAFFSALLALWTKGSPPLRLRFPEEEIELR